jgi:hypothetical protein
MSRRVFHNRRLGVANSASSHCTWDLHTRLLNVLGHVHRVDHVEAVSARLQPRQSCADQDVKRPLQRSEPHVTPVKRAQIESFVAGVVSEERYRADDVDTSIVQRDATVDIVLHRYIHLSRPTLRKLADAGVADAGRRTPRAEEATVVNLDGYFYFSATF